MSSTEPRATVPAAAPTPLRRAREVLLSPNAVRTLSVAVFFLIWEYYGRRMDPIFMAPPSAIFAAAVDLVGSGALRKALLETLWPFSVGMVLTVLVGILHGSHGTPYGREFARAHVELPKRIVAMCGELGVQRYLHMSALGADSNGPSMYLRSKGDGEAAALSDPRVATTIFRPSVVFGDNDRFLNLFAELETLMPVMFLGGADAKFQPVYVEDVAQAFVTALHDDRDTIGKCYELAGPNIYTLRELVRLAGEYTGHQRPVIGLSPGLARMLAAVLEHMPGSLMSRDNLDSMRVDNIASEPIAPELGIIPTALEAVAPYYLTGAKPHSGLGSVPVRHV